MNLFDVGEIKMAMYLACGLTIVALLLKVPLRFWAKVGKKPYLSANWVTFWRFPLSLIGFSIYFWANTFTGFCVTVFAFTLDRIDGKIAQALDEENKKRGELENPRYPGSTELGKRIDPLMDKLTVLPPLIVFWAKGLLNGPLVVSILIMEMAGTFMRDPFLKWRPFSWIKPYIRGEKASGFGKYKFFAQWSCLLFCMPLDQKWMDFNKNVLIAPLAVSLGLSLLSVVSRLHLNKKIHEVVDGVTESFNHKE